MNQEQVTQLGMTSNLKKAVVFHPYFREAYDELVDAVESHKQAGIAQHILCLGRSGTGKSTLKKAILARYPEVEETCRIRMTVLSIDIPSKPTIRNVAEAMLIKLGDLNFHRSSAIDKTERIITLIKEKSVHLMIFDENQHFIDHGNKNTPYEVSDWLKVLIDRTNVSTILMGLPRTTRLLALNEQLRRRFSRQLVLHPFQIDTPESASVFVNVIRSLIGRIGSQATSPLERDPKLITRLYYATDGIIDYIGKLLIGANKESLGSGRGILDLDILEQAFSKWVWQNGKDSLNPFNKSFKMQRLNKPGMPFHETAGRYTS